MREREREEANCKVIISPDEFSSPKGITWNRERIEQGEWLETVCCPFLYALVGEAFDEIGDIYE